VLDLCAAPGTKTSVLAAAMRNTGIIYATDADSKRLAKVVQNCQRLGINNVKIIEPKNLDTFLSQKGVVDIAIVDVSCSNTGVLARRAEARHRLDEKSVTSLAKTQSMLLQKAILTVRPGGTILYSTCSILRQENELLIKDILRQNRPYRCCANSSFYPPSKRQAVLIMMADTPPCLKKIRGNYENNLFFACNCGLLSITLSHCNPQVIHNQHLQCVNPVNNKIFSHISNALSAPVGCGKEFLKSRLKAVDFKPII